MGIRFLFSGICYWVGSNIFAKAPSRWLPEARQHPIKQKMID
jgi:hypothetical protein